MSDMKAFEIQTFQGGKWKIDSVFDDRDLAMFEAQRMDESSRYSGVRVVEEVFSEATQETRTRTIYRGSKIEANNAAELRKSKEIRQRADANRVKRQQENVVRKKQAARRKIEKKSHPVRLFFILLFLAVLAGGAFYWLQQFEHRL